MLKLQGDSAFPVRPSPAGMKLRNKTNFDEKQR